MPLPLAVPIIAQGLGMGLQALGASRQAKNAEKQNAEQLQLSKDQMREDRRRFDLKDKQQQPFRQSLVGRLNTGMQAPSVAGIFSGNDANPFSMAARGQQYVGPAPIAGENIGAIAQTSDPRRDDAQNTVNEWQKMLNGIGDKRGWQADMMRRVYSQGLDKATKALNSIG